MSKSGNKSGGYVKKGKQSAKPASASKENAEETNWQEAQEAMFAVIRELLEAQRRAHGAGEGGLDVHVAAMRKLLRYVRRKIEETGESAKPKRASRQK